MPRPVNRKKTGRKADQPAALRDIISLASAGETELAAFATGALITGAIINSENNRVYRGDAPCAVVL